MIEHGLVCATLPTSDMARSRRFYEDALGLREFRDAPEGGAWYEAGAGTLLHIYESVAQPGAQTDATFLVEDFEQTIAVLRSRGVALEEYDLPGVRTDDGVWRTDSGFLAAWIKDPDGNILGIQSQGG